MKIHDSIKGYDRGIGKVIPPEETCRIALEKIESVNPPILSRLIQLERPTGIPQYRIIGSPHYWRVVQAEGTNGKGHFDKQALASGIMELIERYSCHMHMRDKNLVRTASFEEMKNNPFGFDDFFVNFLFPERAGVRDTRELRTAPIRWHKGYSLDGEKVSIPLALVTFLLEGTNGMAAGNSFEEALLHAICEVIERHCLTLIEYKGIQTPRIDMSTIRSPIANDLIARFKALRQPLFIKDFSLGVGLPVIGVVREVEKGVHAVTTGVATTAEEALIRALIENSQTEGKKRRVPGHFLVHGKAISMGSIKDVNSKNIRIELEKVKGILERQGMKVFFVDTTDKALRIPSVFVYIRGAKYFDPDISDRNVSLALIEESFAMRDYARVETLIARGKKAGYIRKGVAEYYKGAVLMLKKRYRKAIPYLRYASRHCAVREHKKFALVKLGIAYQATGNVDRALDHYIMMVHRYPDFRMDFTSPFKRGASVRKAKRVSLTDSVRDLYDDVRAARIEVRNCPTSRFKKIFKDYRKRKRTVQAGIRRSHGDFKAGEYRRAVKTVEKMRRKNSLVDIMHNVSLMAGYCYERMGEYGKAVEALQKATRLNPEAAQIYFTISRCYRNTGQNDKAEKAFTAGIRAIEKYKKQDFVEREHALVKGA